ncbi:MAG: hypothetical protein QOJ65_2485, partial [Fimbriimonadaceae bacterium]|nr:hypothetical protein [Fimbriimonadaceae bacterium]
SGKQAMTSTFYVEKVRGGNNLAFLDGHVKFMTDVRLAAGTDYVTATPRGEANAAGAVITDKKKYLWNLDDNYYGLY